MLRWLSLAAFVVLLGLSWLIFELTNVWPFNAEKILAMRALFAFLALSALGFFLFGRRRSLPAALLLVAFASTTALSNAVTTPAYLISAGATVLFVAVVSRAFGPPLSVR